MEYHFIAQEYIDSQIKKIKDKIGDKQVICTVSGGLKSTVVALMLKKALVNQLHFIFIDTGLLLHNEAYEVLSFLRNDLGLNIWHIDAKKLFLSRIENIIDFETKTKIIKNTFFDVLNQAANDLNIEFNYLIDGSECFNSFDETTNINFQLIEPLLGLCRNDIKEIANTLNLPQDFISKRPLPIWGLASRIIGKITTKKLELIRKADYIFNTLMKKSGFDLETFNYFCLLLNNNFEQEFENECESEKKIILLKAFSSNIDGSNVLAPLSCNFLKNLAEQICLQIPEISFVFYDIFPKNNLELYSK